MTPLEETGKFVTVVIDPPWPIRLGQTIYKPVHSNPGISAQSRGHWDDQLDYKTLDLQSIAAIPVPSVLADDAWLFCWTVNQFIPQTYGILESWGCQYSFTMTWIKNKGPQFPGKPCFNTEWCIVGKKGTPSFIDCRRFRTGNYWERPQETGSHSQKPKGFYDLLRRVTKAPRLDIFGRRRIAGFQSWGNEASQEDPLPDHYQQVLLD